MLPSPDTLNAFEHGKFVLSNLAAKRAKQLLEGAPPLVQVESRHPLTIALAEIAAGKIKAVMPTPEEQAAMAEAEAALLLDETLADELGLLLPSIDELEEEGATLEEDEDESEDEEAAQSLSDLVGEEDEESTEVSDEETLSLSDLAEDEAAEEDSEDLDA